VCVGQNFSLSATSSAASSFQWLGPQNFSSAQLFPQSLANSLAASGVYTVVVAAASSCTAYASANVLVVPVPVPSVALSSSSICANNYNNSTNQIVISAQGANQYTITAPTFFGGGALNTNSALLIYAGPNAAPSQVAMGTISGNNGYCSGSSTFSLMVYANPTINFVTVTPSICVGKTATASVSGGSSYVWQCSSAYTAQSTAGSTIITVPNSQVFYTVTAYNSGCASLSQYTSTIVYAPPQLQITPPQSSICLGEGIWLSGVGNATEYQWLPSTNFLGSATQSIFVMPQTSASYSLIAGINSCTALTVAQVSILPLPTPSIVASATSVCSGDKVILLAPGSYSYEWRMPKGSVSTGSLLNLVLSSPDDAGEYTLTAINSANCRASKTIKLLVNPKPFLHLSPFVESACAPYCTTFSADTSFTYIKIKNWQLNNKSVYTKNLSACFSVASIYTFAAIFSDTRSNCFSSKEFSIHIHPKPFANFTFEPSQPVEGMDIVNFTETSSGEQINTWQWHQPDAPIFEGPRFTRSFENAGSYPVSLMVSTSNNCKDTITKTIQVESDFALYVPNSFSPNNDGKNDVFQPIIRAGRNYTLQIFSRWGQELFSTTDISGNWDGRYRNEDCKQDVYQWTLQITTSSGNRISKTGTVLLMR
jgi:gliding motility-associated-like protein